MNTILIFIIVMAAISIIGVKFKLPPFFTLVGGAVAFGLMIGSSPDTVFQQVALGCASIFNSLGIPILAGSVIAKYLAEQGLIQQIVSDLRTLLKRPPTLSGIAGYLIAVPSTCPITAFIILTPVIEFFTSEERKRSLLIYLVAIGSVLGVAYVYPTPVTYTLFDAFAPDYSPLIYNLVAIPLSLAFVGAMIWYVRRQCDFADITHEQVGYKREKGAFHLRAWAPFLVIFLAIPVGYLLLDLTHAGLLQFIMLAGMATAVATAKREVRWSGWVLGAKHGGVVIFDICGAGALGYIIQQSSFPADASILLASSLPIFLFPFVLAALIQTAQGSRIVTSYLTAQVLASTVIPSMLNPLALFLMIIGGAGLICFVTDPYFWLLHRTTGDDVKTVLKRYTLPQVIFGVITYLIALLIQFLMPVR
ncbi:MAG: putative transporter [Euryarchaeota archaeon ADurb.Bin165]|nr:MAG: putative transporter [Euryarchaeota archaeon ADurb.Bin165]